MEGDLRVPLCVYVTRKSHEERDEKTNEFPGTNQYSNDIDLPVVAIISACEGSSPTRTRPRTTLSSGEALGSGLEAVYSAAIVRGLPWFKKRDATLATTDWLN